MADRGLSIEHLCIMTIKALAFDTGGTILDWHRGISTAFAAAGAARGLKADWTAITNEYRRRSLKGIVNAVHPSFNFDDVHRSKLDEVIADFGLDSLTDSDRNAIWRTWHALEAWPGFVAAARRLRKRYVVASFRVILDQAAVEGPGLAERQHVVREA